MVSDNCCSESKSVPWELRCLIETHQRQFSPVGARGARPCLFLWSAGDTGETELGSTRSGPPNGPVEAERSTALLVLSYRSCADVRPPCSTWGFYSAISYLVIVSITRAGQTALERAIFLKSHLSKLFKPRTRWEEEGNPSRDSSFHIPSPWQILPVRLRLRASSTKGTRVPSESCLFSPLLYFRPNLRLFRARSWFCIYWSFVASDHVNASSIKPAAVFDSSVADTVFGRAARHSLFAREASGLCRVVISARTSRSQPLVGYSSGSSQREFIYCC